MSSPPHCSAPADPSGVSTIKSLKNAALNAWLRSLALLHVIAEHALRNTVRTELEIRYRDLSVTSQTQGKARREWALQRAAQAGQRSQAVVCDKLQKKPESSLEPKVTRATFPVAFQGRAS